jgi:hypothetical protein
VTYASLPAQEVLRGPCRTLVASPARNPTLRATPGGYPCARPSHEDSLGSTYVSLVVTNLHLDISTRGVHHLNGCLAQENVFARSLGDTVEHLTDSRNHPPRHV